MTNNYFYFAYGSNMNANRMRKRLPYARRVGVGYVLGWEVAERLYANLERKPRKRAYGVVYVLNSHEIATLDKYEGCPYTYTYKPVNVHISCRKGDTTIPAWTYTMTESTLKVRKDMNYPEEYRRVCDDGAKANGIPSAFKRS